MIATNKTGLPRQFMEAALKDTHPLEPNRYYVTELLKPTKAVVIHRGYDAVLEEDVADMIPAMLGSAFHKFMEENTLAGAGQHPEYHVEAKFGADTVSGTIDLWDEETQQIWDYKTCSASKVMKSDFEDWRLQGLMYALLLWKTHGATIKKLRFFAVMKDWSKIKAASGGNYPQSAVYVWEYDVSDSDYDYIEGWANERFKAINACLETGVVPQCSPEERWHTGDKWAVYKKVGDKRAAAVCDTEDEANAYMADKCGGSGQIEYRPGECLKCKYYCPCAKICAERGEL